MSAPTQAAGSPLYTGTQVNYYLVCARKLWLFSHDVTLEHTSERVELGRLIHETSFARERKEVLIDRIKIDFSGREGIIHEVKKGRSLERAHRFQLLYYLYYLKQRGVENVRGELHYPKLRRRETVELTPEAERELEAILTNIERVLSQPKPLPRIAKTSLCKKCSYYELCYA